MSRSAPIYDHPLSLLIDSLRRRLAGAADGRQVGSEAGISTSPPDALKETLYDGIGPASTQSGRPSRPPNERAFELRPLSPLPTVASLAACLLLSLPFFTQSNLKMGGGNVRSDRRSCASSRSRLTLPALLSRARLFLLSLNLSLPARTLFQGMKSAMARDKAAKKAGTNKGSEQAVRLISFPIAPRTT